MAVRLGLLLFVAAVVLVPGWSRPGGGFAVPRGTDAAARGPAPALETGALRDTPSRITGNDYDRLGGRRPSSTPPALALLTGCLWALLTGVSVAAGRQVWQMRSQHPPAIGSRAPPALPSV